MFKRVRRERETPDVNLIPVMNLFVTLIPFLLLGAAFYHVGVIPASLPTRSEGAAEEAPTEIEAVTMSLLVTAEHFDLSTSTPGLPPEALAVLSRRIPRAEGSSDHSALSDALYQIKQQYPESDTVILLPEPDIEYQDIVHILDTARERPIEGAAGEALFPVVVFSQAVIP